MKYLSSFKKRTSDERLILVVSGLPRSGTSLMMQILNAAGIEIMNDNIRTADEDNPNGYYESERVKQLRSGDIEWLKNGQGKAVKVISALLEDLPARYSYKVIFMQRKMEEVLASQRQMLIRRGEATDKVSDETMAELFNEHLDSVTDWLARQPNMEVLYINYDELVDDPKESIEALAGFLNFPVNLEAMLAVPDKNLHRQRSQK